MSSFSLLSVLGSGSLKLSAHGRFPIAAYQSGSVLVLWDYARASGECRKFILLQPNQHLACIFFSKDAQSVLAIWLSQHGQPVLTVWRTTDGARLAEHRISEQLGSPPALGDFHPETSLLVHVHGGPVVSASVVEWNPVTLSLRHLCRGPLPGLGGLLSVRLVDDGRHFMTGEARSVQFWAFAEQAPRAVLQVDVGKSIRAIDLCKGLVYLVPDQGRVQVMNFQGQRQQQSVVTPPETTFAAIAASSAHVCLGDMEGTLHVLRGPGLGPWKCIPLPEQLRGNQQSHAIRSVTLGMNEDYACVTFASGAHGVAHLASGSYAALRIGHGGSVQAIAVPPRLRFEAGLVGRLVEPEQLLLARTFAFLTIASDLTCIAWPLRGPPLPYGLESSAGPSESGT